MCYAVKFFPKQNYFIFGYFDPTNIFFDNKNKYFFGGPKRYFGLNGNKCVMQRERFDTAWFVTARFICTLVFLFTKLNCILLGCFDPENTLLVDEN